ncbi:MAG: CoA pyrophosphatase [Polyangiaceae bacterium]
MIEPFSIETVRDRLRHRDVRRTHAAQRASVAMILGRAEDQLHLMFIQRAEHPADPWSGHMALPGGRRDPGDASDLDTALRETLEEVGIDLATQAELLGELDDVRATARGRAIDMAIAPFVFYMESLSPVVPNIEVVAAHWAPLGPLFHGRADSWISVALPQGLTRLPAWTVGEKQVWGLTFRMVKDLFRLLSPTTDPSTHAP